MTREEIARELKDRARLAEEIIRKYLPDEDGFGRTVTEAMNYSVLAGGKRLRPILMMETYCLYGGQDSKTAIDADSTSAILPFMAAIEFIHNYSLVHDDLPAMDNDLYRRGKKTTHAVYGAGMATLAGDGLLNLAFETALAAFDLCGSADDTEKVARALRILADKAGINGMVGGQCADLEADQEKRGARTMDELMYIHKHKTAAMIESSLMIGAVLAGASDEDIKRAEEAGEKIGLAFQIRDDILDAREEDGSDASNDKLTWVSVYGEEQAKKDVERLSAEAADLIGNSGDRNGFLYDLIDWMITREL
ncbi:MAG: polyprenyl synthetase family protein [Lachnospiraceae bacterium]|nr:polyprenyl synthetase family protein [Lachnospiraceae bacterium]